MYRIIINKSRIPALKILPSVVLEDLIDFMVFGQRIINGGTRSEVIVERSLLNWWLHLFCDKFDVKIWSSLVKNSL
jgi:hypothetical protein